jgi:chondroitin 4-sulfotransferase 11
MEHRKRIKKMINEEYKFIRIHIKKTGGRSLWAIFPQADDSHAPWREYHSLLRDNIKNYFVWTIVRNPWERLLSHFFYQKIEVGNVHTDDFVRFVEDIYMPYKFKIGPYYNYETGPQLDYLTDESGELAVDYIAYLPNISNDFEKIKKRLRFPAEWNYPHCGSNKHEDYRSYYNKLTVKYVYDMYEKEIEFFGFDFEDNTKFKYPYPDLDKEPLQQAWRDRLIQIP